MNKLPGWTVADGFSSPSENFFENSEKFDFSCQTFVTFHDIFREILFYIAWNSVIPDPDDRHGTWIFEVKFFLWLFLVDKTLLYENLYDDIWGSVGNSSYKPFFKWFIPLGKYFKLVSELAGVQQCLFRWGLYTHIFWKFRTAR